MGDRLIDDGIGILAGLDFAGCLAGFEVEDSDVVAGAVAGKAFAEIVGDGDSVHARGVGNGGNDFIGGGVDHFGLGGMRDVEPMVGAVDVNIVPAGGSADFDLALHLVNGGRGEGERGGGQQQ